MDTFVKRIKFEAVKDDASFKSLSKTIDQIGISYGERLKSQLQDIKQLEFELKELHEQLDSIKDIKGFEDIRSAIQEEIDRREKNLSAIGGMTDKQKEEKQKILDAKKYLQNSFLDGIRSIGLWFLNKTADVFSDAWSELKNINEFSRLSSSKTRELAFTYGFNSSQSYGYSEAMRMMGFESEEDLMYATTEEITQFKELFQKYTNWYETVGEDELAMYREFEIEVEEMKKDLQLTVVDFFLKNKDEIKAFIEFAFTVGEYLIDSLGWFLKYFGGEDVRSTSEKTADAASIISNWSNTSTVNKNNFNNTFNIQGGSSSVNQSVADNLLLVVQRAIRSI